jgi:prolyl-tRNA editing enzyme YbaK/EbsC (Cys-tRNA(Pro) deacylase)
MLDRVDITHILSRLLAPYQLWRHAGGVTMPASIFAQTHGCTESRIMKSVVFKIIPSGLLCGNRFLIMVLPVDRIVDKKVLTGLVLNEHEGLKLATPKEVEMLFDQKLPNISALGVWLKTRSPVVVCSSIMTHKTVIISTGKPAESIELPPTKLPQLCSPYALVRHCSIPRSA